MPAADTYGIHVILGPFAAEVPTLTVDVRMSWIVAGMLVVTVRSTHWPTSEIFDGLGAKQEILLSALIADANAPEDSNCMMCRPAELPVCPVNVSWKPVNETGWLNK